MTQARSVVVTGAAGGIGRAAAERLAKAGWKVVVADRDAQRLRWADDAGIPAIAADISIAADNQRLVETALERHGRLDAAILNAGITGGGGIEQMSIEQFQTVLNVNLVGAVLGIRAALPALRAAGGGAIAVTASTMGLCGDTGNWAYCAAKHGLIGVVRSVAREVGWQGIRINALCPGLTQDTGMTAPIREALPDHFDQMARPVPLQRWASPDEMAAVLEFLVSPASSYVNGHAMVADGGAMVGTGLAMPAAGADTMLLPDGEH